MRQEIYYCDVCNTNAKIENIKLQVIFTTEQDEGRSVTPYLTLKDIDICDKCLAYLMKGNYLFAAGAMGHNTYNFRRNLNHRE